MKNIIRFVLSLVFLIAFQHVSYAEKTPRGATLTIDEPVPKGIILEFDDEDNEEPKVGEFEVLAALMMSNNSGERWATITIYNQSSSQRLFDREHILALFANGEKRHPHKVEYKFNGHEEKTLLLNFGRNKFPILRVYSKN